MRVAIVIPTLDEEAALPGALRSAADVLEPGQGDLLVVADGGSSDRTLEIAERAGARRVAAAAGRGSQLNAGAEVGLAEGATGLLFLHADTRLPPDARRRVADALADGAAGGGFTVRFDSRSRWLRLGQGLVNLRTRALRVPLGDQAQFAAAEAFRSSGGFPAWPILEDLELLRRLRRRGPISIVRSPVLTSARRFEERGVARTVAGNWLIWTLFFAGLPPHRLARLYRHVR